MGLRYLPCGTIALAALSLAACGSSNDPVDRPPASNGSSSGQVGSGGGDDPSTSPGTEGEGSGSTGAQEGSSTGMASSPETASVGTSTSGGDEDGTTADPSTTGEDPMPGAWHCPVPPRASEALASEYAAWRATYYEDCGESACIRDGARCVSEGIGYGMLISVGVDAQGDFDELWRYYQDHTNDNGVMHWQTDACGGVTGRNGASDAELDVAMALVLAEARWGGYREAAEDLITRIRDFETETCDGRLILRPGDAWGGCSDGGRVNPSYFAPGYYDVFARFVPAQADHWNTMAADARDLLAELQLEDGRFPDWANLPSTPDGSHGYEACRVPWRLATDYCIVQDEQSRGMLEELWAVHGGAVASTGEPSNSAFVGSFALTGVVQDEASYDAAIGAWLEAALDDEPYYQATLRVLYLTTAAGVLTY